MAVGLEVVASDVLGIDRRLGDFLGSIFGWSLMVDSLGVSWGAVLAGFVRFCGSS